MTFLFTWMLFSSLHLSHNIQQLRRRRRTSSVRPTPRPPSASTTGTPSSKKSKRRRSRRPWKETRLCRRCSPIFTSVLPRPAKRRLPTLRREQPFTFLYIFFFCFAFKMDPGMVDFSSKLWKKFCFFFFPFKSKRGLCLLWLKAAMIFYYLFSPWWL